MDRGQSRGGVLDLETDLSRKTSPKTLYTRAVGLGTDGGRTEGSRVGDDTRQDGVTWITGSNGLGTDSDEVRKVDPKQER